MNSPAIALVLVASAIDGAPLSATASSGESSPPPAAWIAASWPMDEGSGEVLGDRGPWRNDGKIFGAA